MILDGQVSLQQATQIFVSLFFSAGIPSRRSKEYIKQPSPVQSQTAGTAAHRARTYLKADPENSEPLNSKQPGVLNVDATPSVCPTLRLHLEFRFLSPAPSASGP
jgi:hypothetical protein